LLLLRKRIEKLLNMSQRLGWDEKFKRLSSTFKPPVHIEHAQRNSLFWSRKASLWSTNADGKRWKSVRPELRASKITTRQSMVPLLLLCVVFIILGFTGGMVIDEVITANKHLTHNHSGIFEVLNKRFQETLGISKMEYGAYRNVISELH